MKINIETVFHFGKHKGQNFKWVLMNDINYLRFLFRKGFKFEHNAIHLIKGNFEIEEDINVSISEKKSEIKFYKQKFIILQPEKGVRKKEFKVVISSDLIGKKNIENVPFEIKEWEVEEQCFDFSAIQQDDRFFTSKTIRKKKVFDQNEIIKICNEFISNYENRLQ